ERSRGVAERRQARARAAAQVAGREVLALAALARALRRERAALRVFGELERIEDRDRARVVAVRVVDAGGRAEAAHEADEVGRVGADEGEDRRGLPERLLGLRECLVGQAAERWER